VDGRDIEASGGGVLTRHGRQPGAVGDRRSVVLGGERSLSAGCGERNLATIGLRRRDA
jgi:hypothetical protein